ncbi:MAG: EscU/YscU/HrcU family type III secretion system export apparatus switch protein [Treponema sp.]|jgi:flagellar biosynthetic protein FlhB|nr:EscU/YscU/HrcU family type III secretion system export apparatus switch protein [Treponema sp.]
MIAEGKFGIWISASQYTAYNENRRSAAYMIDLQWFAAEDEGRTFEPTDTTIRRAREEGRVAKSQELIGALVLLFPALLVFFMAPFMIKTCVEMLRFFLSRSTDLDPVEDAAIIGVLFHYFVRLTMPILAAAIAAALLSNLIQVGFLFTTKPLAPDFTRILPRFGQYFKRTLFSIDAIFNFIKNIFKMAVIGGVAFFIIYSNWERLVRLQTVELWNAVTLIASLAARMMIISALLLLLLSIPDYFFQRYRYRQNLKMSRQAFMEELKSYEGDPEVQAQIMRRYRAMLSNTMIRNVHDADVVITNPTHFAVALEYHAERMDFPMISAKGEDDQALLIRRIARDNGVPVVEEPPLARALYTSAEVGDTVPNRYINLVAKVYLMVQSINEKRRRTDNAGTNREEMNNG